MNKKANYEPTHVEFDQTLARYGRILSDGMGKFVVPIFQDDGTQRPVLVGSGFLLTRGSENYLVSAAHVFDDGDKLKPPPFFFSGKSSRQWLNGATVCSPLPKSGNRNDDQVDIGVQRLPSPLVMPLNEINKAPLEARFCAPHLMPREKRDYWFFGYPGDWSDLAYQNIAITSKAVAYGSVVAQSFVYRRLKMCAQSHILLQFKKSRATKLSGNQQAFPSLKGTSGSPLCVVDVNEKNRTGVLRVVGVITGGKSYYSAIAATDIAAVLALIGKLQKVEDEN